MELRQVAPSFVEMAHRIVWATTATVDRSGAPRTRILHPIWEWEGGRLTGWIATSPESPKASDLAHEDRVSLTYWDPTHDTCTARCVAVWEDSPEQRRAGWERFAAAEPPAGYDPSIIPGWVGPESETFGILRLEPTALRVMPASVMMGLGGEILTWKS